MHNLSSALLLILSSFLLLNLTLLAEEQEIKKIGNKELADLLAANEGKVVLIDFWASFSTHCRNAVPFLNELYESYKEQGFEIISISVELDPRDVKDFAEAIGVKYLVFMAKDELLSKYRVNYIPHYIFIDRKGRRRDEQIGLYEMVKPEFERKIVRLLKE